MRHPWISKAVDDLNAAQEAVSKAAKERNAENYRIAMDSFLAASANLTKVRREVRGA
jgi:hypothetical protein